MRDQPGPDQGSAGFNGRHMLQPLDGVGHEQRDGAEEKHRKRVLLPILLLFGIDTAEAINQPLDRPEEARQRLAVALENTKHIDADGLGYSKYND